MKVTRIFSAIIRQASEDKMQEAQLASYSDFNFVYGLKPILEELSELTARTYRSYLIEAQEMVLEGTSAASTYAYFYTKLCKARLGM